MGIAPLARIQCTAALVSSPPEKARRRRVSGWHLVAVFVLGTILTWQRGLLHQRRRRPRVRPPRQAHRAASGDERRAAGRRTLTVGAVLALAAFALVLTTNLATVRWSVAALAVTLVYPYTKRFVSMPQAVLGVAFSFGIPMAFCGGAGRGARAGVVAARRQRVLVLAYDTEYAMVDRDDDVRIGIRTSALTLGRWDVAGVVASTRPSLRARGCSAGTSGWAVAPISPDSRLPRRRRWHLSLIRDRSREGCFKAFRLNHWLGCAVFAGVALDAIVRARLKAQRPNSSPSSAPAAVAACSASTNTLHAAGLEDGERGEGRAART